MPNMADEIKTTPEVDAEVPATEPVEGEGAEKGDAKETPDQDLENLLKRERELGRREGAAAVAFKKRQEKREEEPDDEPDDEDKPLTRKELDELLRRQTEVLRNESQSGVLALQAEKLVGDKVIANLAVEILKNRSFPEGLSQEEKLEEAIAIAKSKPAVKARLEELRRARMSDETASDNVAGTHRDTPSVGEPKMSSNDASAFKAAGFTWDGKLRLYVAPLKKGKIMTFDPKTKKRSVIQK